PASPRSPSSSTCRPRRAPRAASRVPARRRRNSRMRSGAIYSGLLHLAILLLIVLGLPDIFKHNEEIAAPVAGQLATLADIISTPHPAPQSHPRPRPVTKPPPPPPAPHAP